MTSPESNSNAKTPLLRDTMEALREAYGTDSVAKFEDGTNVAIDYEPKKLSSFRVCCVRRGTIMTHSVLFVEQALITIIFVGFALLTFFTFHITLKRDPEKFLDNHEKMLENLEPYQPPVDQSMDDGGMSGDPSQSLMMMLLLNLKHAGPSVNVWIERQEPKMRQFAMIMTGLAAFLMALYTSMSVGRWWIIRTQGIGGIKAATVDLQWVTCQLVTQDEKVLSAIRRYGRASLQMVFLWRREQKGGGALSDSTKDQLTNNDLLVQEEVDQLKELSHCLHETIWSWQLGIVQVLRKEGKIKSDSVYQLLLDHCEEGRQAVQVIHTHLAVRIPMQYVHLLCFVVKLHNLILAVIMGLLFGVTIRQREFLICCQLFGRTLILPFLFNAILLINGELSDPFDGTSADDFPQSKLVNGLEQDCSSFVKASQNMPQWIMQRRGSGAIAV